MLPAARTHGAFVDGFRNDFSEPLTAGGREDAAVSPFIHTSCSTYTAMSVSPAAGISTRGYAEVNNRNSIAVNRAEKRLHRVRRRRLEASGPSVFERPCPSRIPGVNGAGTPVQNLLPLPTSRHIWRFPRGATPRRLPATGDDGPFEHLRGLLGSPPGCPGLAAVPLPLSIIVQVAQRLHQMCVPAPVGVHRRWTWA